MLTEFLAKPYHYYNVDQDRIKMTSWCAKLVFLCSGAMSKDGLKPELRMHINRKSVNITERCRYHNIA